MPEKKIPRKEQLVVGGLLAKVIQCVCILSTLAATTPGDHTPIACMDKNMPCKHLIYLMLVLLTK